MLTYTGLTVPSSKVYDGTTTAVVSGTAALQSPEQREAGSTDGAPYNGDDVSLSIGTLTGTYDYKDVLTATTVTFGGVTLTSQPHRTAPTSRSPLTQPATITAATWPR